MGSLENAPGEKCFDPLGGLKKGFHYNANWIIVTIVKEMLYRLEHDLIDVCDGAPFIFKGKLELVI